jgi:hypothetical protein
MDGCGEIEYGWIEPILQCYDRMHFSAGKFIVTHHNRSNTFLAFAFAFAFVLVTNDNDYSTDSSFRKTGTLLENLMARGMFRPLN